MKPWAWFGCLLVVGCGASNAPVPPWDTAAGMAGHYAGRSVFRYTGICGTTYGASSGTPYVGTYSNDRADEAEVEKGVGDDAVYFAQGCALPLTRQDLSLVLSEEKTCNGEVIESNTWSGNTSATDAWTSTVWKEFTVERTSEGIRASGEGTYVNKQSRDAYITSEWTSAFTYEFEGTLVSAD